MFDTILIANRGEIACRIIRTLGAMGIRSVAVYSDADAGAPHVRLADVAVRIGPAPAAQSYLDIDAVIRAAQQTGAAAIHPGYGFLSENATFARACAEAGIVFIGPGVEALETMGDKITAKAAVAARGVPTVPGVAARGLTDADLVAAAPEVGYPLLIKPSAGGGGKGMHVVEEPAELPAALAAAHREAAASFGDDTLFLERYLRTPRHIEVQVLADDHGAVIHLGERECSLQRRHQKVIEEAPSPLLDDATRERIGRAACETARTVGYRGAGTVEFIVSADAPGDFYFMEMNTRLQVEHPVTEEVTGIDLVEQQVRIAAGEPLALTQDDIVIRGHSIEARVYAEDPATGFLPTGGRVLAVRHPSGPGIRVDTALEDGLEVSVDYDPMLAKVIARGADRAEARSRLVAALAETAVFGFATNVEFLRLLLERPDVVAGDLDTGLIARALPNLSFASPDDRVFAEAALLLDAHRARGDGSPWQRADGWRLGAFAPRRYSLRAGDLRRVVSLSGPDDDLRVDAAPGRVRPRPGPDGSFAVEIDGSARALAARVDPHGVWIAAEGSVVRVDLALRERAAQGEDIADPLLVSPMPGTIVLLPVEEGSRVTAGDPVVVVEAMKMEHVVRAGAAGIVSLEVTVGDVVSRGQTLARVRPDDGDTPRGEWNE